MKDTSFIIIVVPIFQMWKSSFKKSLQAEGLIKKVFLKTLRLKSAITKI